MSGIKIAQNVRILTYTHSVNYDTLHIINVVAY